MAGMGKRMRPHTLTQPKPLVPVAGKSIVQRLVEDLSKATGESLGEIAFITGQFGEAVEKDLLSIAESLGAKGRIYYQDEPLGTAHAIMCAAPALTGPVVVAFADTLFVADFTINKEEDGVIWVNTVSNPEQFGVVKIGDDGYISDMVEKPTTPVSDLAIIGIYYFKDGDNLKNEIQYLLDHNIRDKGEYQLTSALENMKNKGKKFAPASVREWLDCGNYSSTIYTNQRVLENIRETLTVPSSTKINNSVIVQPCFIGENVILENAVIGPHVAIGNGSEVRNSRVANSIIQTSSKIYNANVADSLVGAHTVVEGKTAELSISDYSVVKA